MRLLANIVVLYLVFLRKLHRGLPSGVYGKEPACQCIRCLSPGSGKSPGEGHGNPLQYLAWRIPWTEEPGWLQSMGVSQSQTRLKRLTAHAPSYCPPCCCTSLTSY